MTLKTILLASAAAFALVTIPVTAAFADDNDETRELNLRQLDNPGSDMDDADDEDDGDDADDEDDDDDDDGDDD